MTATIVVAGVPADVTEGLNFDGDFFKMQKKNRDETVTRKGLRDSSYTALGTSDSERIVELEWIPGSPAIRLLTQLKKSRQLFRLVVRNESDPAFLFIGDDVSISEEPETVINGKTGFKNTMFKLDCPRSEYEYL